MENAVAVAPDASISAAETIDPKELLVEEKRTPKQLYCICRTSADDELMIQCDTCGEWYHTRCLGISEEEATSLERYDCPNCVHLPGPAIMDLSVYERLCARETCMNVVDAGGVYCSPQCLARAAADPDALRHKIKQSQAAAKKRKKPASPTLSADQHARKLSASAKSTKSTAAVRAVAVIDPIRTVIQDKFTRLLRDVRPLVVQALQDNPEDLDLLVSEDDVKSVAVDIEGELFLQHSRSDASTGRSAPTDAYKLRFRKLDHHLHEPV